MCACSPIRIWTSEDGYRQKWAFRFFCVACEGSERRVTDLTGKSIDSRSERTRVNVEIAISLITSRAIRVRRTNPRTRFFTPRSRRCERSKETNITTGKLFSNPRQTPRNNEKRRFQIPWIKPNESMRNKEQLKLE
ncbi:uncharacterized protein LOC143154268 [Ptiloglossa arizonensis]|uniref:uncharacterized protein LOC143154268 n=1 Tax=Ptiloglossa arizonensis TaxID=3350558 RepID=UPI003F9F0488